MTDPITDLVEEFNPPIREAEVLLSIARDSELQRQGVVRLSELLVRLHEAKQIAIASEDEDRANALLGFECVAASLRSELMMWLFLKREEPEKAWDCLVEAQTAAASSVRAHDGFEHNVHHTERLEAIEQLVFPPQVFTSSGLLVDRQLCSICGQDYDECEHLATFPYMGEFCSIVAEGLALDHVSLVDEPADKRCRIVSFETPQGIRNRMTWKVEPLGESASVDEDGRHFGARVLHTAAASIDPREVLQDRNSVQQGAEAEAPAPPG